MGRNMRAKKKTPYLDEKILSINEVAEIIKNKTGIEFGGF